MKREIIIPGEPIGQPRPRATIRGGHAAVYAHNKSHPVASFKAAIRLAWGPGAPCEGPVTMTIEAVFSRPKSKVWKSKEMPSYPHTSKPDWDNCGKAVSDALNGLAFRDDSQVVHAVVTKRVASGDEQPHTQIVVEDYE